MPRGRVLAHETAIGFGEELQQLGDFLSGGNKRLLEGLLLLREVGGLVEEKLFVCLLQGADPFG